MRQQFPMNLRGKQIGHILGYIPGALYGQAVLQGMSRAYQGVLEEANQRIVEFRLRATMPASLPMTPLTPPSAAPFADLLAAAQSKAVPPAISTPGEAFSLLSMSSPAMPAPVTPEGVFGPMPVGGGDAAPHTPPSFPILATPIRSCGHDSGSYDPGYPACDYDSCSDDSGYPSCDYDFCSDNSSKLSIPAGGIKATASMELSHVRGQRGRYASWGEQRQRETTSL